MADGDRPKRERARLMYLRSRCTKTAAEIGKALYVSPSTVRTWKKRDRWDADGKAEKKPAGGPPAKRKAGGQPGNQNALCASRDGNTNAECTGEHSRITPDTFSDEEKDLIAAIPEDHRAALRQELELLTVRERRMMQRIRDLQTREDTDGLLLDLSSSTTRQTSAGNASFSGSSTTQNRTPAIDRILRVEEALTRVQAQKSKVLLALHEHETKQCSPDHEGLVIFYDYGEEAEQP